MNPSDFSHAEALVRLMEAGDAMADALEGSDLAAEWDAAMDECVKASLAEAPR